MSQAIALARKGTALAHPNPMVGAVLVKEDRIIGEGFHVFDRLDHAEIAALNQAAGNARGASLYVSLEPCCSTGRTGPCTKAIIAAGVKKVYVAMKDPNPRVAGGGLAILKRAGIDVQLLGDHRPIAQELNEAFAKWILTREPFVTLKSAMTLDGYIAPSGRSPKRATAISGKESHEYVQRIRHASDALITGIGTVLADNPLLTDRTGEPRRRKLLRVLLDSQLRLPLKSNLVKSADGDLLVFTTKPKGSAKARDLAKAGAEIFHASARRGRIDLREVLRELAKREMLSVLIEAGAAVNGSALEAGIVDKLILFYAPKVMLAGGVPFARASSNAKPRLSSRTHSSLEKIPPLMNLKLDRCGADFVVQGYFRDVYRDHGTRRKN
jgi:diaminohydroxyphosphoribosylaminopyrimidine deaminase/5-amino-6-(5-phosphoribosylamino)uracil reductase